MSNINIFELESVQDLNEQEVGSVVGGWFVPRPTYRKKIKLNLNFYKDIRQVQSNTAVQGNNANVGDHNDQENNETGM